MSFGALLMQVNVWAAESPGTDQLVTLPLEQLMQFEVDSVSKRPQKVGSAPASVSIVSSADIKTYGYRTLAEILASMRGLYVTYDRNYSYLGVRGFFVPGDYNTRILLLVDGVRYNDVVYDQVPIGTDFSVDVDLIERVEFIAGPASAVYGSNALLGVINVVTKTGADFRATNLAGAIGSYGTSKGRATIGDSTATGASWLISASRYNQRGQDLYFAEFDTPEQNHGIAEDADYDRITNLLAKYHSGGLTVTVSHGDRTKGIPTASYGQTFNDNRAETIDTRTNLGLQYQHQLSSDVGVMTRLYSGYYDYQGTYIYNESLLENRDETHGSWTGGELQATLTGFDNQHIVLGAEYRYAPQVDQTNFDVAPRSTLLNSRHDSNMAGYYVQDELALGGQFLLNLGGRLDRLDNGDWVGSPRIGAIWQPDAATSLKLLHGTAYRTPNAYEQYYYPQFYQAAGADSSLNSGLKRERMTSDEIVLEHALGSGQRVSVAAFHNDMQDLIALHANPEDSALFFANSMDLQTEGAEVEWLSAWISGAQIKANYTWQQTRAAGNHALSNSPRHLFKLNVAGALTADINYGVNARAVSTRDGVQGTVPGYGVVDLTLRSVLTDRVEIAASLYNALDHRYFDPGSSEHVQAAIMQDERSFVLRLDYWL